MARYQTPARHEKSLSQFRTATPVHIIAAPTIGTKKNILGASFGTPNRIGRRKFMPSTAVA